MEEILDGKRLPLAGIDVLRKIVNHPDLLERTTMAASAKYGEAERSGKQLVTVRPPRYCSPRHRSPFDSVNESSKRV